MPISSTPSSFLIRIYNRYARLSAELAQQPQGAPKIKIIDATIDLCAAVFPWAKFRSRKGAISLHTILAGLLPSASSSPRAKPMTAMPSKTCTSSRMIC
jgi:hypothetical protein